MANNIEQIDTAKDIFEKYTNTKKPSNQLENVNIVNSSTGYVLDCSNIIAISISSGHASADWLWFPHNAVMVNIGSKSSARYAIQCISPNGSYTFKNDNKSDEIGAYFYMINSYIDGEVRCYYDTPKAKFINWSSSGYVQVAYNNM